MPRQAPEVTLSQSEHDQLEQLAKQPTAENRLAQRARIVLKAADGATNLEIADALDMTPKTVGKWRRRWVEDGFNGLEDRERPGRPRELSPDDRLKILNTATSPPEDTSHWSLRDLQKELEGDVDISLGRLHQLLDDLDLKPHKLEYWLNSTDPDFEEKQAAIVGLYLDPPDNAFVVSVDEKTQIQTNTPLHPDKPMEQGTPQRREFQYERKGTQNLFAALVVHSGEVIGEVKDRKRSQEFVEFLDSLDESLPEKELHLIADNLSTHKTNAVEDWLEEHPRVQIHYTPTHASWLNQIELWFSILQRKVLNRGFFESKAEKAEAMIRYIEKYNEDAKPFKWTYDGDPLKIE